MKTQCCHSPGKEPPGKVRVLAGLVGCPRGSIVSRTLIDKRAGTVTLFGFGAGQGLSEHAAPYDALVLLLTGRMRIRIAGRAHDLKAGHMILMPARIPHALDALTAAKMLLILVRA